MQQVEIYTPSLYYVQIQKYLDTIYLVPVLPSFFGPGGYYSKLSPGY